MPQVMLKRNWGADQFRRTVPDGDTAKKKQITFAKGVPVEVTDEQLESLSRDLGRSLALVAIDERGKVRICETLEEVAELEAAREAQLQEPEETTASTKKVETTESPDDSNDAAKPAPKKKKPPKKSTKK